MRLFRYCLLAACLLAATFSFAQKEDWLPITQQDLQIKEVPGAPGAPAIQLYYADFIDDVHHSEYLHHRIKILNEKGIKYANVELTPPLNFSITDLKARTIHPDGKIIEFSGKAFEKTVIKGKGVKILAKTFTLPDVTVGSMIEYRYRWIPPESSFLTNEWIIQHNLYTVKEYFRMKPYQGLMTSPSGEGPAQISVVYKLPGNLLPKVKGDEYQMEAENIPAFEEEEYMPPAETYKPHVRFFYELKKPDSIDKFWADLGKGLYNRVQHFIGNSNEVKQAAKDAIGDETEPGLKLRRLYERAQKIRNLTYERDRTAEERKRENLKKNESVADVLKHGYGTRQDITRLFVALARASGFDPAVLEVSDRKDKLFDKGVLSEFELDTEIVMVKLDATDLYLDPGTRFCPYGLVRWMRTSTDALKLDPKAGSLVTVPPAPHTKAVTARSANMALEDDGSLKGAIAVEFKGLEALERRLEAIDSDDAGRKKGLEDELKTWLSSNAVVKLTDVQGWEGTDDPLVVKFQVELPAYASIAGKRVLMPTYFFQMTQQEAFKHETRKYPVYFPYCFSEIDLINIKVPARYTLESVPKERTASLPYARYQNVSRFSNGQLATERALLVNGIYFDKDHYPEMKDFFKTLRTAEEEQIVFVPAQARSGGN